MLLRRWASSRSASMTCIKKCDAASITFDGDTAVVACRATLEALQHAARLLHADELVAFPTETVYGLGAGALSSRAVERVFAAKGRPADNPLIVHVSSPSMLPLVVPSTWPIPRTYRALMARFWPGPLTLLFPTSGSALSSLVTAGHSSVAVRMPSHAVARALISMASIPIAAPSANSSGKPSPTTAQHVYDDLVGKIQLVLDGSDCQIGIESTVIDGLSVDQPLRILRLGGISVEDVKRCLSEAQLMSQRVDSSVEVFRKDFRDEKLELKPTTPGMKYKHYSPTAKVIVIDTSSENNHPTFSSFLNSQRGKIGIMVVEDGHLYNWLSKNNMLVPSSFDDEVSTFSLRDSDVHVYLFANREDPNVAARRLFKGLRYLDEEVEVGLILIEKVSERGIGAAVMERMRKAAGGHEVIDTTVTVE